MPHAAVDAHHAIEGKRKSERPQQKGRSRATEWKSLALDEKGQADETERIAMENQALLQLLMEAEKDAKAIVSDARGERKSMMKDAMVKAENDVKAMRDDLDAKLKAQKDREMAGISGEESAAEEKSQKEVAATMSQYEVNKEKAIQMLVDVVTKCE